MSDLSLGMLLSLWIVAGAAILMAQRRGEPRVGLVVSYLAGLALIHWFGAAMYFLDSNGYYSPRTVKAGFDLATLGAVGFAVGCSIFAPIMRRLIMPRVLFQQGAVPANDKASHRLPRFYLVIGLLSFFVLGKVFGQIPTLSAVVAGLRQLMVVGICLGMWQAFVGKNRRDWTRWLMVAVSLPLLTVVFEGFLGYGIFSLLIVFFFIVSMRPFRLSWIPIVVVLCYFGLSLFVTYSATRDRIRELTWYDQDYVGTFSLVMSSLGDFELFDNTDHSHRKAVDDRLNQNWLVGSTVDYIDAGRVDFVNGATILAAAVALVPRAVWPNKPEVGGSGDIVSSFTGIEFAKGTSVGVGQVFEFYINFGAAGVFVGFLILGLLISYFDFLAGYALHTGNYRSFALWFLAGIGFLQTGGSLAEVTTSVAAGALAAILVNRFVLTKSRNKAMLKV